MLTEMNLTTLRKTFIATLTVALLAAGLRAAPGPATEPKPAERPSIEGTWQGTLTLPGRSLRLAFRIHRQAGGGYGAVMDSLDQGLDGIPVDKVTFQQGKVRMDLKALDGFYQGDLKGTATMEGTWHQHGHALPLALKRTSTNYELEKKSDSIDVSPVLGTWEGKMVLPEGSLRILFHISRKQDGSILATMDSPDQSAVGIPVSKVTVKGKAVTFEVSMAGGTYTGTLQKPGTLTGTWEQSGLKFHLALKRTGKAVAVNRPQEPKPPFPYRSENVTFPNKKAGITLAGTLTLPKTGGPFPAVLLISGSGPENRNEEVFGHKPFLVWADYLTRRGIAVLRVDDRGTAHSTGDFATATDDDFVDDALAGVAFLKTQKDIDPREIGLMGHSEGGIIAPKAAVRSKDVAFIVILEGPGLPFRQILKAQSALILKANGASDAKIKEAIGQQDRLFKILGQHKNADEAKKAVESYLRSQVPDWDKKTEKQRDVLKAVIDRKADSLTSPWLRGLLDYDPKTTLEKVTCPVLAVGGSKDLQVPAKENLAAIAGALKAGGNKDFTTKEFEGLNHLLQPAKTGSPSEYSTIETTVSPKALKFVGDWILALVKPMEAPGK
jgi:hypothetical protein